MEDNSEISSMNDVINEIDSSINSVRTGRMIHGKVISVTDGALIVNIGYMTDGIVKKQDINPEYNFNLKDNFKVDDEMDLYVVKMEDEYGNVVLSKIKADEVLQWNRLSSAFKNDEIIEVMVNEVVKGGITAYINGVRAFIPDSQVSVKFVKDFNELVGKTLKVKIIEIDEDRKRVILSGKEVEQIEIEKRRKYILDNIQPGEKVKGKVDKIVKFGAFVDLGGIDGLIHISELSRERVKNPEDVVSLGDELELYVINVDRERSRISLSLKDVYNNPLDNLSEKYTDDNKGFSIGEIFKNIKL